MSSSSDDRHRSHELQALLVYTAERMKEDFVRAVTPLGVSAQEARAILLLDEPLPMGALAQRLTCDQSYITRIADDLEAHGLAKRSPGEDRRVQLLTLTRSGARMRDRIIASVSAESLVLQRLDEDQRRTLEELLRLLLAGD